jgi:restriction system protein
MDLSPDDRRELLPGGTQRVFDNCVAWAKTYLVKAKLSEAPQKGKTYVVKEVDSDLTAGLIT